VDEAPKVAMPNRSSGTRNHEEEGVEEDGDRRAEGASVVDNGNKAVVPVGGSGNSRRGNVTNTVPAGDASVMVTFKCCSPMM
jgi:hypothetical protein